MRIAIHHRPNSYSSLWIKYCQKHNIQFKLVDAYANDILNQIDDCDAFMWHFHYKIYKDNLFAKQLIYAIKEKTGKKIYPDFDTCWHYDDKIGQKYFLQALDIPIVPTYIFYTKKDALNWIRHTTFPKVFKLRSGEDSKNVRLVKSYFQAKRLIRKSFGSGFQKNSHFVRIKERWIQYRNGECTLKWFLKGIMTLYPFKERFKKEELGYIYFQDFIPNNKYDIRVFVVGNRAVAVKRINRQNDFRASGSGNMIFEKSQIDEKYIRAAFSLNKKLKMQSVTFDFLLNNDGHILLSEFSYNCGPKNSDKYPGYWTDDMQWHDCNEFNVSDWIIENIIKGI